MTQQCRNRCLHRAGLELVNNIGKNRRLLIGTAVMSATAFGKLAHCVTAFPQRLRADAEGRLYRRQQRSGSRLDGQLHAAAVLERRRASTSSCRATRPVVVVTAPVREPAAGRRECLCRSGLDRSELYEWQSFTKQLAADSGPAVLAVVVRGVRKPKRLAMMLPAQVLSCLSTLPHTPHPSNVIADGRCSVASILLALGVIPDENSNKANKRAIDEERRRLGEVLRDRWTEREWVQQVPVDLRGGATPYGAARRAARTKCCSIASSTAGRLWRRTNALCERTHPMPRL